MMRKTIFTLAAGCFLLLGATSCTDESLVEVHNGLAISGNISTESRVALVDAGSVTQTQWEVNDAIGLYTSTQRNISYKATGKGKTTDFVQAGNTVLESEEGKKVRAYYPYSNTVQGSEVPLPFTIAQYSERETPAFLYSEATIKNNRIDFTFRHVLSYLKITVSTQQYRDNLLNGYTLNGGIFITSDEAISVQNASINIETMAITHKNTDNKRVFYYAEDLNVKENKDITYLIPILPQTESANVAVHLFYPRKGNTNYFNYITLVSKKAPQGGFKAGYVYEFDTVDRSKQQQALSEFYKATGGANWSDNDNWLSNKPLDEWFGLNSNTTGLGYVQSIELSYNNLRGTLPSSFAKLMDNAIWLDISRNYLSGEIPNSVKNHDKWNSLGWTIVPQETRQGGGFNLSESNLYAPDDVTYDLLTNSRKSLSNIFAENKLTQVIIYNSPTINNVMGGFSSDRVNHYLDYANKGLGTVIYTSAEEGADNEDFINALKDKYGSLKDINWMYGSSSLPSYFYNFAYVFDSQGQLVHLVPYSTMLENESVIRAYDDFLRAELGEPEKHDEFGFDFYTSTDYSRDREVFVLQRATQGNGLNLVLMGEGFVDKDMGRGGKYEQKMMEATEKLFSLEPYTSLRKRFNVYGVKVVSPTAEFTNGAPKRINENNNIAFQYALNCEGLNYDDRLMVTVIYNSEDAAGRSYCSSYSDGSFVAYNMGAINNTIIHEVCGHGIAKLADEYVEGGYETISIPEGVIYNYKNFYWNWDWGWYKNIDYRNDASTINWAHMLADSRYAKEDLGIFEGAATYGKGCYRPSTNSMMRYNISWFNAPSREMIYKAVMTLSEGKDWKYDYKTFVKFDEKNIQSYSRSAIVEPAKEEIRKILERHVRPKLLPGTWRDALNSSSAHNVLSPLR